MVDTGRHLWGSYNCRNVESSLQLLLLLQRELRGRAKIRGCSVGEEWGSYAARVWRW